MESHDSNQSPYVKELKEELTKIDSEEFVHATRLVTEETKRVESGDKYKNVALIELHHERPVSNAVKIRIPAKEYPKVNFSGKLLGPKGSTLKQLQQETGCKLSILGKGSMRDKMKEEELRKEGGKYGHLNEELHVLVECFAEPTDGYSRLSHAVGEIKKFMNPNADPQELQGMMGAPPEERGFFNGDNHMGRGGPGPRGGPSGRGGMLNAPGRGGMAHGRGGAAGPPSGRGSPAPRGGPPSRGAPSQRGAPVSRGGPPMRGAPAPSHRGAPSSRGSPMTRGSQAPRGAAPSPRGRGLPPVSAPSRPPPVAQDYEDYGAEQSYTQQDHYSQNYTQENYDDGYSRREQYVEETYPEPTPVSSSDTQYFDYGHGSQSYDEYESPRAPLRATPSRQPPTSVYDRPAMKAPSAVPAPRGGRGTYRAHPYDSQRPAGQSRFSSGY